MRGSIAEAACGVKNLLCRQHSMPTKFLFCTNTVRKHE